MNPERHASAGAVCALLSAVFAASILLPLPGADGRIAGAASVCLFYHLTGLPCPGCGLTRSFVCLGHGRLWESLHWHPLGPAVYGLCGLLWLRSGVFWARGIAVLPLTPRMTNRLGAAGAVVLTAAWIIRLAWMASHHLRF